MFSENAFFGYCQEMNKIDTKMDVPNEQWLEEMGDMIEAAVKRLRTEQSEIVSCHGRLPAA